MRSKPITQQNTPPRIVCTSPWRLTKVKPLANFMLYVEFIDGTTGTVEMSKKIMSDVAGVFAALRNIKLFNQVHLEYGAVTWPGAIDLAPDVMYEQIKQHDRWQV